MIVKRKICDLPVNSSCSGNAKVLIIDEGKSSLLPIGKLSNLSISGGATEEQAKQIEQNKTDIDTLKQDLEDKANTSQIPTKTSQLENDSGFLTQHQDISGKANKATTLAGYGITDGATKQELSSLSNQITNKVTGTGITNIVKLTQAEYDAMTSHDSTTLYVIEG